MPLETRITEWCKRRDPAAAIITICLAAYAVGCLFVVARVFEPAECDTKCEISRIKATLMRIQAQLDRPTPNVCDTQWPLGRPPKERSL